LKNILKLLASIIVCQAAGVVGSFFTIRSVDTWYASINKPFFNPPNSVFGPVWLALYFLMGFSLFLVWQKGLGGNYEKRAFTIFIIHLALNSFWSFAFFGCQSPIAGLIVIILLWLTILWLIISFYKISRAAAILLIPYILWVSFAAILNSAIYLLNR
jgi:tryptophan-rich sensory protein